MRGSSAGAGDIPAARTRSSTITFKRGQLGFQQLLHQRRDPFRIVAFQRQVAVADLTTIAQTLHVPIEELIGEGSKGKAGKRGPAPKIQQQLERVSTLPKPDPRAVMRVLDSMLAQAGR